jgi:hypothetical protein
MILRALAIALSALAAAGLWFGYANLNMLRGTPFFDFRYIVFAVAAFLGLSVVEWALGKLKAKVQSSDADH